VIQEQQPKASYTRRRKPVVRKNPNHPVGKADYGLMVGAPRFGIGLDQARCPGITALAGIINDHFREQGYIPNTQIETLPSNGVQLVSRIAYQYTARPDHGLGPNQFKRELHPDRFQFNLPEPEPKCILESSPKLLVIQRHDPFRLFRRLRPDHRTTAIHHRQNRQRSG
jgi:hypothetical protein